MTAEAQPSPSPNVVAVVTGAELLVNIDHVGHHSLPRRRGAAPDGPGGDPGRRASRPPVPDPGSLLPLARVAAAVLAAGGNTDYSDADSSGAAVHLRAISTYRNGSCWRRPIGGGRAGPGRLCDPARGRDRLRRVPHRQQQQRGRAGARERVLRRAGRLLRQRHRGRRRRRQSAQVLVPRHPRGRQRQRADGETDRPSKDDLPPERLRRRRPASGHPALPQRLLSLRDNDAAVTVTAAAAAHVSSCDVLLFRCARQYSTCWCSCSCVRVSSPAGLTAGIRGMHPASSRATVS